MTCGLNACILHLLDASRCAALFKRVRPLMSVCVWCTHQKLVQLVHMSAVHTRLTVAFIL